MAVGCVSVRAQCNAESAKLGTLVKLSDDDGKKPPLLLVHGIQGIKPNGDIAILDDYWKVFLDTFWKNYKALQATYTLYVYQYCSDRVEVSAIAAELRNLIDDNLTDRNHVILAHSMGGLVATAYMADTVHLKGNWKDKAGGDTTIGLITLATPHHGTPGANSPKTLERYVPLLYRLFYPRANKLYWESTLGRSHPAVNDSTLPNRSDLRWDNYDLRFDNASERAVVDLNKKLYDRNQLFKKYDAKLIAYSGYLANSVSSMDALETLNEMAMSGSISSKENKHRVLNMANYFFGNGLSNKFKPTDGLVPFDSGLFCGTPLIAARTNAVAAKNFICSSGIKVRRFEPGNKEGLAAKTEYPDKNTLSIFRSKQGFDHLDMLENKDVLDFVVRDLKGLAPLKPATVSGSKTKK
jgi:triacylglycerol esterase/lipase EstA (alpha/beta hydrolase family)